MSDESRGPRAASDEVGEPPAASDEVGEPPAASDEVVRRRAASGGGWSRVDSGVVAGLTLVALGLLGRAAVALAPTALEPAALGRAADVAARLAGPGGLRERLAGSGALLPELLGGALAGSPSAPLERLRLGGVLLAAGLPGLVYGLARGAGRELAVVAGLLALLVPRGLVDGATLGGEGAAAALLWAGLLAHRTSQKRPGRAVLAGLLLALAAAASWGALLAWPALLLHRAWTRPAGVRGQVAVPTAAVAMAALLPVALGLTRPALWGPGFVGALGELLVGAASPGLGAGLWAGAELLPDTIPRFHTLAALLLALPSLTTVLAVSGLWRWGRAPRRAPSEVSLAAAMVASVGLWPLVAPAGLGQFPGHAGLVVPAAALLAAHGLAPVGAALGRWQRIGLVGALVVGPPGLACTLDPATLSASIAWITGGPWRAAHHGPAPLHDGSAIGPLLGAIEASAHGRPVRVWSPDVAPGAWLALHRHGRLRADVRPVVDEADADLLVRSGAASTPPGWRRLGLVRRDGQPIVALEGRTGP